MKFTSSIVVNEDEDEANFEKDGDGYDDEDDDELGTVDFHTDVPIK